MVSASPVLPTDLLQDMSRGGYEQLVVRARQLVESSVPEGMTVAVVSRGDSDLLRLAGRNGWHFPRTDQGVYAGHHPANDLEAIAQLEATRAGGADYLLLPATSFWWLDYYAGFKRHLEARYERVAEQQGTGIIFSLAGGPPQPPPDPDQASRAFVEQVRAIASALLPAGAKVLIATSGDDRLLDLGGPIGSHFPQSDRGVHSAVNPAGSSEAVAHLEALRAAGAEFLIIPLAAHWWLEHYGGFRAHLREAYPLVTRQANVCTIYDLRVQLPHVEFANHDTPKSGRRNQDQAASQRPRKRTDRRTRG